MSVNNENDTSSKIIKKPLIISSQQWNCALKNLNRDEDIKKKDEDEKNFKEYLKKGSEEIKNKWPTRIIKRTPKSKNEDQALKDKEQLLEVKKDEEKIRMEKIDKANKLIMQLKPGPRELDSAAMCSELIRGREIQKSIKAEFEKALKENERKEDEKIRIQNENWAKDQQQKILDMKKRNEKYRNELQKQISDNQKTRTESAKQLKEYEKLIRGEQEKEMKEQIEREKITLERKREAMRKSALEAMKMMEQRRLRKFTK